mmetsp:Transcript_28270/g.90450  ORF Transcript_28270/g.90450 Transcript_28270/m.90450 type:complete len:135 (-) Transcript_28270:420-824(-)
MASYALLARLLAEGAEFKWKTSRGPKPPPPPPPPGVTFYVKLAAVGCAIGAGLGVYAYITYRRKLREHRLRRMSSAPHEPIIDTNRLAALEAGAGGTTQSISLSLSLSLGLSLSGNSGSLYRRTWAPPRVTRRT